MKSITGRLLTTFVGLPCVAFIVFGLPQFGFLGFTILAMAAGYLGTKEVKSMIEKATQIQLYFPTWFGSLLPLATWAGWHLSVPQLPIIMFLIELLVTYVIELKKGEFDEPLFNNSINRMAYSTLLSFYPGFLLTYLVSVSQTNHGPSLLGLFFVCVFANDIFAFLCGMTFGKNNRGIVKVSPNKSVAGFIGGALFAMIFAFLYCILVFPHIIGIGASLLIGLLLSLFASIGDLVESEFKRNARIKDSGNLIPGRGGAMDNLDSLVAAAPIFFLLIKVFKI